MPPRRRNSKSAPPVVVDKISTLPDEV
ncbi:hypothetical protein A2U01_0071633, partial [Trifolium medium]|nr:hypothetical protein [Trifolium medium]